MSDSAQDDASQGSTEATAGTAEAPGTATVPEGSAAPEVSIAPEVSTAPEPGTGPEADGEGPDLDDVKRQFREALDRKNKANAKDSSAAGSKGKGKAQVAHGPASTRRSFRRKSG